MNMLRFIAFVTYIFLSSAGAAHATSLAPRCMFYPFSKLGGFVLVCLCVMSLFRLLKQRREGKIDPQLSKRLVLQVTTAVVLVALPYMLLGRCEYP